MIPYEYASDHYLVQTVTGPPSILGPEWLSLAGKCHSFMRFCHASDENGNGTTFGDGFATAAHVGIQVTTNMNGRARVTGGSRYTFMVSEPLNAYLNAYGQFTQSGPTDWNSVLLFNVTLNAEIWRANPFAGQSTIPVTLTPGTMYSLYVSGGRDNRESGDPSTTTNFVAADVTLWGALLGFAELSDTSVPRSRVPVTVTILRNGSIFETKLVGMTDAGRFSTYTNARGDVEVVVKPDHFLSRRTPMTVTDQAGYLPYMVFLNGDINNDNEVGPADFALLAVAFGSFDGDPNYTNAADLNDDGEVGPADFSILATNFGSFGE